MRAPKVDKCANHQCPEHFKRIGKGKLYIFPVSDPKLWDLPPGLRQKAVWLCDECCRHFFVRLDRTAHSVLVLPRKERHVLPKTA
jgi:hypothetical protein